MGELTIVTNRHWRQFVYRYDVPKNVLADQFDYQLDGMICWSCSDDYGDVERDRHKTGKHCPKCGSEIEPYSEQIDGFFKYRGYWYHLDQFMRIPGQMFNGEDWNGYHADSFFSGILIRMSDDGEEYGIFAEGSGSV